MPDLTLLARTLVMLAVAFVLGTLIGFERQWRHARPGCAPQRLSPLAPRHLPTWDCDQGGWKARPKSSPISFPGSAFLGAGVILKDGTNVRGLNTAATLWCSAAVGAFSGSGLLAEAVALTLFVLLECPLCGPW